MTFKDTYRLEKIYYENVYTLLNVLKSMKNKEVDLGTVKELLDNAIADNESIIIIYKNLGQLYSEMQINLTEIGKQLKEIRDNIDSWKDEINDKIDYLNNSLMIYIREIWQRLDAIEADLAQMGRLFTYELTRENDEYILTESGNDVTFESTANLFSHNRAHLVTVRGNIDGEQTYFFPREYDLDSETGLFEWYSFGFVGNEIHEITVTLLPDNSVNVSIEKTDFELILLRLNAIETSLTEVIQRVTNAEEDIDTLEQITENLEENKQDKLVAGSGITIDQNTNEISAAGGLINYESHNSSTSYRFCDGFAAPTATLNNAVSYVINTPSLSPKANTAIILKTDIPQIGGKYPDGFQIYRSSFDSGEIPASYGINEMNLKLDIDWQITLYKNENILRRYFVNESIDCIYSRVSKKVSYFSNISSNGVLVPVPDLMDLDFDDISLAFSANKTAYHLDMTATSLEVYLLNSLINNVEVTFYIG